MVADFKIYQGKINLSNGPGCYKITEDALWLLSTLPLDKKSYLEVGCATGVISLILKLKNPKAEITAIDIQNCMIEQALEHAERNNIKGINFKNKDLFNFEEGNSFDCVFSNPPFFKDYGCACKDKVKDITRCQKDLSSFIKMQLDLVKPNGILCFIAHISTKDEILKEFSNSVDLTEIALISSEKKQAKRFIYIIHKNKNVRLKQFSINSFDKCLRNNILFHCQALKENNLNKIK